MGVDRCHCHVYVPGVAVPLGGMEGQPPRQPPELRQHRVHAPPVVQAQQREPELSPRRDRENALVAHEPSGSFDQRIAALHPRQSRGHIDQGRHEKVRSRVFVQAPPTARQAGLREVAENASAPTGRERPADEVMQQHILRGQHGAPGHLAFPTAVFVLEVQQAPRRAPQCGIRVHGCDRAGAAGAVVVARAHGDEKSFRQPVRCFPYPVGARAGGVSQVAKTAPAVADAHRQCLHRVACPTPGAPGRRIAAARPRTAPATMP